MTRVDPSPPVLAARCQASDVERAVVIARKRFEETVIEPVLTRLNDRGIDYLLAMAASGPVTSTREDRFILLGLSLRANVLIVCHCLRGDAGTIRIISARKATKREEDT